MTIGTPRARFDPERLRRARAYRAFSLRLTVASTLVGAAVMVALYLAGAGRAANDTYAQVVQGCRVVTAAPTDRCADLIGTDPWTRALVAYAVIVTFGAIGWLAELPHGYVSWRRGRREGLVVQSFAGALVDRLKGLALTMILIDAPLAGWFLLVRGGRPDWPLWTILGVAVLSAAGTLIGPALASLFFRFEPLSDAEVASRVRAVAERAGVRVSGVYQWGLGAKTTAANAAVLGIGPTKRIVLGDTLTEHFPADEVEAVVAHEVGHDVSGDPPRYVAAFTIAGSAALIALPLLVDALTCGVEVLSPGFLPQPVCGTGTSTRLGRMGGMEGFAPYPLFAALLYVLTFVGRPILMAFTRWRESAADTFGARYTSRETMARALVRLADQNLSDPEPPRWEEIFFYSHPAIANRVRNLGLRWDDVAA